MYPVTFCWMIDVNPLNLVSVSMLYKIDNEKWRILRVNDNGLKNKLLDYISL